MNVEIGTETPIFLLWEYLFQIFGILSLQCTVKEKGGKPDRKPYNPLSYGLRNPYKKPQVSEISRLCPKASSKLYMHGFSFSTELKHGYWPQSKTQYVRVMMD
jgi:hypothetical protein